MGGIFKSPKKEPSAEQINQAAEKKAEEERKKGIERQRRGLDSTIHTSYRGILDLQHRDLNRKKLLGE